MAYNNVKRAKAIALANPELNAKITKLLNTKSAIYPFELRALAKNILAVIEPEYVGPTKGVYLLGDATMRLAAKRDATALAELVGRNHKRLKPHLYNK